ncbi:hypothetical protein AAFF_G00258400 [Aldrovandia affinis]|uniref:Uncharacterized protein n=1 Tax=Aldrovandia affinis TaxID=143900 RepID=A0AAD7SV73_9TELE|nr:hypothetical protein AAFF_G00258400 [Aldrovandia affinis]
MSRAFGCSRAHMARELQRWPRIGHIRVMATARGSVIQALSRQNKDTLCAMRLIYNDIVGPTPPGNGRQSRSVHTLLHCHCVSLNRRAAGEVRPRGFDLSSAAVL